ncbi:hypothetical protein N7490_005732 [Penicillium lividum]|nr:hypothetical protein N7490_005732 [Penicillium lividum]
MLYLSHGRGGAAAGGWQNQAYISNILDRLMGDDQMQAGVLMMSTWHGILPNTTNSQFLLQHN